MNVLSELAVAYVSIRASTGGLQGDVKKALTGLEPEAAKTGRGMGEKLSAGMGKTLKRTAIGVGVAGGAALAAGMTKGIGRLNSIEKAESKLKGLGNSASTVSGVMENALASVKGTAFGLEEAATVASSMVASGIKPGRELEAVLKTVGDTAAIAGTDMASMGDIFGKVAAKGKLQGNELFQLSQAGIPALQLLSSHLGKTSEEVTKMVSKGEIDFKTFSDAMAKGVGGAALEMGNTTSGALMNMMAAAGRVGATLAGPFFTQAGGAFRGVTDLLDGMNKKVGPVMDRFGGWLEGTAIPALAAFGDSAAVAFKEFAGSSFVATALIELRGVFSSLASTAGEVWPALVGIAGSLGEASQALGVSAWQLFVAALQVGAAALSSLTGPLNTLSSLMERHQGVVTALVAGYAAFKTIPAVMGRLGSAFAPVVAGGAAAKGSLSGFSGAVKDSYKWMGQANPQMGGFAKSASILGANASAAAKGGLAAMQRGGKSLLGVFGGPLGAAVTGVTVAVTAGIAANQKMQSAQESLASASDDLASAQADMWSQIGDASGIADSVVDQVKAVGAAMDAEVAGSMRGFGAEMAAIGRNFSWEGMGASFRGENLGQSMLDESRKIADGAESAKAALDELGVSDAEVSAAIAGSAGDWNAFSDRLRMLGDGGVEAANRLQPLRDEVVRLQEAEAAATPGSLELSAAVDTLADSASTADDKLDAMRNALEALGLIQTSAEQQAFQLADSVDKVAENALKAAVGADEMGNAFFKTDGSLNPLNKSTHDMNTSLVGLGDEFISMAQKTGSASEAWGMVAPQLEGVRAELGLTTEEFQVLLNEYGLNPEKLQTLIDLEGTDEVRQKLGEVSLLMDKIPDTAPKTIDMLVKDEAAQAALVDLGYKVKVLDSETGMVRITADGSLAVAGMSMVTQKLGTLDKSVATPDIHADTTVFQLKDQETQDSLRNLDTSRVDPEVGAIIDDFINGRDVTLAELARIDKTVADPTIKAEISQALQKAQIVNDALDRAARDRTSTITTHYQSFYNSVNTGGGRMQGPGIYADGGIRTFADGGLRSNKLPETAMIAQPQGTRGLVQWAENETEGEAFIPLAKSKRGRSTNILSTVADKFGYKLEKYANGGVSSDDVLDFLHNRGGLAKRSLQGAPYDWAGVNWGDCSAAQAAVWRFATGQSPFGGRFATASQLGAVQGMGGKPGPGGKDDITTGWYNGGPGGGHTTGSVGGVHFEMGGGAGGQGKIGGAAASPFVGPWQHIYHLPLEDPFDWSDKKYTGPSGTGLTVGDYTADAFTGNTGFAASGGGGGTSGGSQRPTTWSGVASEAAATMVGGLTEDALGVFGIPNQLPPALQAWNMLNDPIGGGPSDWDLSVLAAQAKQLDAQVQVRSTFVDEAAKAITAINTSPVGNALPAQMIAAQDQLDAEKRELERIRAEHAKARERLEDAIGARAEAIAGADNKGVAPDELAEIANTPVEKLAEAVQAAHVYDPSKRADQWVPLIEKVLRDKGLPLSYKDSVVARMNQESSGNPRAQNNNDSNARAGNPSKGGMQTTQTTFDAFADPGHKDIWNMEDNLRASMNYVTKDPKFRGRSLQDVYMQAGGYNAGGWINGLGSKDSVPLVGAPGEFIVNRRAAAQNRDALEAMNSGNSVVSQSGGATYNIYAFDLDEAMATTARRESQHAQTYMGAR